MKKQQCPHEKERISRQIAFARKFYEIKQQLFDMLYEFLYDNEKLREENIKLRSRHSERSEAQ